MKLTLFAIVALAFPAVASAEECKIEDWTYRAAGGGTSWTYIDGSTSCAAGRMVIRIYDGDGDKFLATETVYIEGFAFTATVDISAPKTMNLKYSITD